MNQKPQIRFFEEALYAISHFPLFADVPEKDLRALLASSGEMHYGRGETICREGAFATHIPFLLRGYVKIFIRAGSHKHIVDIAKPRRIIGLSSIFGGDTYDFSAVTLDDCMVYFLEMKSFINLTGKNSKLSVSLLSAISSVNSNRLRYRLQQNEKNVRGRIAGVLLHLSEKIYAKKKFDMPLTRSEMATFAGTSTETCIRILSEFRKDKIINSDAGKIEIINTSMLRKISEKG
jgi:CRP/FNR family transcriptional regulator, polysaccharide utilization system transcription regulator